MLRPGTNVFGRPLSCISTSTSRVSAVSEILPKASRPTVWSSPSRVPNQAASRADLRRGVACSPVRRGDAVRSRSRLSRRVRNARAPRRGTWSSPVRRRRERALRPSGRSLLTPPASAWALGFARERRLRAILDRRRRMSARTIPIKYCAKVTMSRLTFWIARQCRRSSFAEIPLAGCPSASVREAAQALRELGALSARRRVAPAPP